MTMPQSHIYLSRHSSQSGSALLFILIGVALFAALSYVVATSSRTGNSSISKQESAKIAATEIFNYGAQVKGALEDLMLSEGCSLTQISFWTDKAPGYNMAWMNLYYDNPNSPADRSCHIFDSDGGNVTYVQFYPGVRKADLPIETRMYHFVQRGQIHGVGEMYRNELRMIAADVSEDVCKEYNRIAFGKAQVYYTGMGSVGGVFDGYTGGFSGDGGNDSYAAIALSKNPIELYGQPNACAATSAGNSFVAYYTLIER